MSRPPPDHRTAQRPAVRHVALRFVAGSAVSLFFIWLALRDKDLPGMWEATRKADLGGVLLYLGILLVIHLLRTVRWGLLLEPVGRLDFATLNRASAIGFMALLTLPLRLGEFARPYLVSTRAGGPLRMSAATASVVLERIIDGITTAALLLVSLLLVAPRVAGDATLAYVRGWSWIILGVFVALLLLVFALFMLRERAVAAASRLLSPLSPRLASRVSEMLGHFIAGLRLAPHRGKLLLVVTLTAAYWGINGLGMYLLAGAFHLELGLLESYAVLGVLIIGVMIPAGPGMLGTFQFFVLLGLSLFVERPVLDSVGAAYANALWALQFAQQVGLGLLFMLLGHQSFRTLLRAPEEAEEAG